MKKGFTLIELLAVIVIIGLISVIAIPTITGTLKSYQRKLLSNQLVNIENAARSWGAKHMDKLPTSYDTSVVRNLDSIQEGEEYGILVITLQTLQDEGLIDSKIKNPVNKKEISPTTEIYITNLNNEYQYEVRYEMT